jgi:hypothetical protein
MICCQHDDIVICVGGGVPKTSEGGMTASKRLSCTWQASVLHHVLVRASPMISTTTQDMSLTGGHAKHLAYCPRMTQSPLYKNEHQYDTVQANGATCI